MDRPLRAALLATAALAVVTGCIIVGNTVARPQSLARPVHVDSPMKVHLTDGSIVVMRYGATVSPDTIRGIGMRYSPTLKDSVLVHAIGVDSVVGAETFAYEINQGSTFGASLLAFPLAKIAFGSCPTIYSDSAGHAVLESEAFSYSIAPLLAKRDVDRLRAQPNAQGMLRLEVRNEALETHYIDHVELLEIHHPRRWTAIPAAYGRPIVAPEFIPPVKAYDRAGRNVLRLVTAADEAAFGTDTNTLANATEEDLEDWVEFALPVTESRDSIALALRMRSSLLTTVLFYDYMLARAGARSIDWMAKDLTKITTMASLAKWYTSRLGLHIEVRDGNRYRKVARLVDFGPIAWREIGVALPTLGKDTVHVRLRFVADEWRIDRVAYAPTFERRDPRSMQIARVIDDQGAVRDTARAALRRPDESHVTTTPGSRFYLEFETGLPRAKEDRSFLIAEHGYYTEWIRGDWIRNATDSLPFDPNRVRMSEVLTTWRQVKDSLEHSFFIHKVPVS